jgi:hypothetical protein
MDVSGKGIVATGTIDNREIEEKEWYRVAAANPVFDFLREPEENIYTANDGRPFYRRPI